jgi:hypothetical protein
MVGFLFRLLSFVALVIAIVAGTIDSIQSVSASEVVLTPFGAAWSDASPASLEWVERTVTHFAHPAAWRLIGDWLLPQPAFAVFLCLALLFWMLGYRRPQPTGHLAA